MGTWWARPILLAWVASMVALPGSMRLYGLGSPQKAPQGGIPPQNVSFTIEGKITDLSRGKMTVDGGENMLFEVRYDAKTEIQRDDGNPAKASDLRKGMRVKVGGELTEAGEIIAKKITIESASKGS